MTIWNGWLHLGYEDSCQLTSFVNLLQIHTKVLNEELQDTFSRWYSGFDQQIEKQVAMLPHVFPLVCNRTR
jgi:hypothetical protein